MMYDQISMVPLCYYVKVICNWYCSVPKWLHFEDSTITWYYACLFGGNVNDFYDFFYCITRKRLKGIKILLIYERPLIWISIVTMFSQKLINLQGPSKEKNVQQTKHYFYITLRPWGIIVFEYNICNVFQEKLFSETKHLDYNTTRSEAKNTVFNFLDHHICS